MSENGEHRKVRDIEPTNGESEAPQTERGSMGRRDFLRLSGAALALLAVEGCAPTKLSVRKLETTAELVDRKEKFVKRWNLVVEQALGSLATDKEMEKKFGAEEVAKLSEIIRSFDIEEYIGTLSKLSAVQPQEIGGEILSLDILPSEPGNPMAAVKNLREMKLYMGEWAVSNNSFHKATIHSTLRHELAHIFSFDYDAPLSDAVPIGYQDQNPGWTEKVHLGRSLYEGSTEMVALATELDKSGTKSLEQGYRGGGTLSAYVLSELLGRPDFLKAYLRRDPKLLKSLFNAKIGRESGNRLTMSVNIGAGIVNEGYNDSLDFLHNAFQDRDIDREKLDKILEKAKQDGINERADHFDLGGLTITTHLFTINDSDQPARHAFNAVVQAPWVYRFNRAKTPDGYEQLERFGMVIQNGTMSEDQHRKIVSRAADVLKRHCLIEDPSKGLLIDAHAIVGYDKHIEEKLKRLDVLQQNVHDGAIEGISIDKETEEIWRDINKRAVQLVTDTVTAVYEQAGVSDLVYEREKS